MTQEWMKDSTLEGIDPAKMALLQSLIQQGSKKIRTKCLHFNVRSSQFKEKRTAVQPRRDGYDYKGVKKGKSSQEIAKMDRILSMMKMLRRG